MLELNPPLRDGYEGVGVLRYSLGQQLVTLVGLAALAFAVE